MPQSDFSPAELRRLFVNSPSPEPFDEKGEEGREWAFEVVAEEVDGNGEIVYEVEWDNWERADGTTQTWHRNPAPAFSRAWRTMQRKRRKDICRESIDIELGKLAGTDIHNLETSLRAQAFEEKVKARALYNPTLEQEMHALLAEKLDPDWHPDLRMSLPYLPGTPETSSRMLRQSPDREDRSPLDPARKTRSRTSNALSSSTSRDSSSASSTTLLSQAAPFTLRVQPAAHEPHEASTSISPDSYPSGHGDSFTRKRKHDETESESLREVNHVSAMTEKGKAPMRSVRARLQLSNEWTEVAQTAGAAPISFVNDFDDEEIPVLPPDFNYIEKGYVYSNEIHEPSPGFHVGCSCKRCSSASECECQEDSEVTAKNGKAAFAYTKSGLFSFNIPPDSGIEVIECNDFCACGPDCINRVAQRPRDIPLQIFKTRSKGWGVRPSVDIKRGKVLGIYSGQLITREEALNMPTSDAGFVFDLDGQEDLDDGQEGGLEGKYSVDSRTCGNWTHFVNHSCGPNMLIYLVGFGTIVPGSRRPYIAFVARELIRAGTELTVDYDPWGHRTGAIAGNEDGMKECFCGSDKCRDWVRMI